MRFPVARKRRFQQPVGLVEPAQFAVCLGLVGGAGVVSCKQRFEFGPAGLQLPGERRFEFGQFRVRDTGRRRGSVVQVGRAGEKHREDKSTQACLRNIHCPILVAAASAPVW